MKILNFLPSNQAYKSQILYTNRGFAALVTILIVASATLIMAYNAALLGIGELEIAYISQKGGEAYSLAEGCVEETLRRIRFNPEYGAGAGNINLAHVNGSCTIEVIQSGPQRTIIATSTVDDYHKVVRVNITSGTSIIVNSWEEI